MTKSTRNDFDFYGSEPEWDDPPIDESEIRIRVIQAFNWYASPLCTPGSKKKYFLDRLQKTGEENEETISKLKTLSEHYFHTVGAVSRMLDKGAPLPENMLNSYRKKISELKEIVKNVDVQQVEKAKKENKQDVQKHMERKVDEVLNHLDDKVSEFISNEYKSDFDPKKYVLDNKFGQPICRRVILYIEDQMNDELPNELVGFLNNIVEAFRYNIEIKKEESKLKKHLKPKKETNKQRVAKNIKLAERDEYSDGSQIKSGHPIEDLFGKKLAVFYNPAKRHLTVYLAENENRGLSVKGKKVVDFDKKKSLKKVIKKPREFFKAVKGKRGYDNLKKELDKIKSKEQHAKLVLGDSVILWRCE